MNYIVIMFLVWPPQHQSRKVVLDYCRHQLWQLEGVASCIWWPASHGSPKLREIRASFNLDYFLLCFLKHLKGFLRVPRQFIKSVLLKSIVEFDTKNIWIAMQAVKKWEQKWLQIGRKFYSVVCTIIDNLWDPLGTLWPFQSLKNLG